MPDDLAALSDDELEVAATPLRDAVRVIQQQLADQETGVYPRRPGWRARALWSVRRLRDELRPLNAEIQRRREAADAARREARRTAAAIEAARSADKTRRLDAARFQAAAQRLLPPDTYAAILAGMEPA
jgi:hypothetical protein